MSSDLSNSTVNGRRRAVKHYAAEDQAFNQISKEAEARLAAKRQARAEAREIRMKELAKQQKEADEQSDRQYEMYTDGSRTPRQPREAPRSSSYISGASSYTSSRRSSEDSTDALDLRDMKVNLDSRELKFQLTDVEEKFRKAMIYNAQLDNEKSSLAYQVELLKDDIEELQENFNESQKECRDRKRLHDQLQRDFQDMKEENEILKHGLMQRDQLIQGHGLILVKECNMMNGNAHRNDNDGDLHFHKEQKHRKNSDFFTDATLISQQSAKLLDQVGNGSLDVRLKKFVEEKQELLDEIYRLRLNLEEEKQKLFKLEHMSQNHNLQTNGPEIKLVEMQREANKQVNDYKYKLKKAEQEITTLQSNISRLESQVTRYKTATENAEKVEDDLKAERRKLQRELRESSSKIEELETANSHLQKRIDKLKSGRTALMKT